MMLTNLPTDDLVALVYQMNEFRQIDLVRDDVDEQDDNVTHLRQVF